MLMLLDSKAPAEVGKPQAMVLTCADGRSQSANTCSFTREKASRLLHRSSAQQAVPVRGFTLHLIKQLLQITKPSDRQNSFIRSNKTDCEQPTPHCQARPPSAADVLVMLMSLPEIMMCSEPTAPADVVRHGTPCLSPGFPFT